jgi:hypothetical protein
MQLNREFNGEQQDTQAKLNEAVKSTNIKILEGKENQNMNVLEDMDLNNASEEPKIQLLSKQQDKQDCSTNS